MLTRRLLPVLLCFISLRLSAQLGGETTYQFLSLTNSARIAALGGTQVAINDSSDLNLPFHNPAQLREPMVNQVVFNYVNYLSDINFGYASCAFSLGKWGRMAAGIHYINYGSFVGADEDGTITGNQFKAGEYALNLIWSNHLGKWHYGFNLKPVYSVFESYRSFGVAADAGIAWFAENELTSLGLVARNFGTQITTYYENGQREPIPFDLEAGISQKLAHAPLVFNITAIHLNHWDLANSTGQTTGEVIFYEPSENFGKQIMRHLVTGIEIMPSRHFSVRAGYSFQRRQELKLEQKPSTVGFSLGFGIKTRRFRLDYASSRFHLAGASNLVSLSVNLNRNL